MALYSNDSRYTQTVTATIQPYFQCISRLITPSITTNLSCDPLFHFASGIKIMFSIIYWYFHRISHGSFHSSHCNRYMVPHELCLLLALYRVLWGSVSISFKQIMMTSSNGNIFPRYWPFVRGFHWSPVNSPHKGQWRGALMFSWICVWINNREAGDLRRYRAHYDVIVMSSTAASLVLDQFNDRPSARKITLKYTYKISESSQTGIEKKNAQLRSEYIFRDLSLS